jgi:hypothetical protein
MNSKSSASKLFALGLMTFGCAGADPGDPVVSDETDSQSPAQHCLIQDDGSGVAPTPFCSENYEDIEAFVAARSAPGAGDDLVDKGSPMYVMAIAYDEPSYGGSSYTIMQPWQCATFPYDAYALPAAFDNWISSVKLFSDCTNITLYENVDDGGASITFFGDTPYVGEAMDNRTTSLIINP